MTAARRASLCAIAVIAACGRGGSGHGGPSGAAARADAAWREAERLQLEVSDADALRRAIALYQEAATYWQAHGDSVRVGDAYSRIGLCYDPLGDIDASLAASQLALPRFRAAGDRKRIADELQSMSVAELKLGHLDDAIAHEEEALVLARAIGNQRIEADILQALASSRINADRWDDAIAAAREALAIYQANGDVEGEAALDNTLGYTYYMMGDAEQALALHEAALAVRRVSGDMRASNSLLNLGAVHDELLHDPERGLAYYQEALDLMRKQDRPAHIPNAQAGIGRALSSLGRYREAIASFEQALAGFQTVDDYRGEINALARVADDYRILGELDAATSECNRAVDLAVQNRAVALEIRARVVRARIHRAAGRTGDARVDADLAVAGVESLRAAIGREALRATYLATVRGAYEIQATLVAEGGDAAAAFAISERAHARALLDAMRPAGVAAPLAVIDAAATQAMIDGDSALVEYLIGDDRSWAWVIDRDRVTAIALAPRAELDAAARRSIDALTARNQRPEGEAAAARRRRIASADAAVAAASRALAALIVDPIATAIARPRTSPSAAPTAPAPNDRNPRRLVIVADGVLHYVPFALLPDPATGRRLGADRDVIGLPSASVLAELRGQARAAPGDAIAVLADPAFAPGTPRLPSTADEARAIAALAPDRTHLYLGADAVAATLARPEVKTARVVHLATHGRIDTRNPERSGLILADGMLGPAAIAKLGLAADLVVLSACETALGVDVRGEGLIGLVHAFFRAGTPHIVAALWQIDDYPTALLMTAFYRALVVEERAPAAALRAAQAAVAADPRFAAPYYWAGFVIEGDLDQPPLASPAGASSTGVRPPMP